MKKFLAAFLALCCVLSCGMICAFAEEFDEPELDINMEELLIQSSVVSYFDSAVLYDGFFAEGMSPSAKALFMLTVFDIEYMFEDYLVSYDEETMTGTYSIPAEEYEALVFTYLTESDAVRETLRASEYYNTETGTYDISTNVELDYETEVPAATFYGYEILEDGSYAAYSYIMNVEYDLETGEVIPYFPAEDDVEGIDYIYVYNIWSDDEDALVAESFEDIAISSAYIPVAINGYVKSIVEINADEFVSTLTSFELVMDEPLYRSEEMIPVSDTVTEEMEALIALIVGSFVSFEPDAFEVGAIVTTENVTKGEAYEAAAEAMKDVSENFVVYQLTAKVNGDDVDPVEEVKATFAIPSDFGADFKMYIVGEDGTAEEIDFELNYDFGTVTAALTKMGTVIIGDAIVEEEEPEIPADTEETEETTVPVTTDSPVTTKPAEKPTSPQTGDNAMFAAIIAMIALAACSAVVVCRSKIK